MSLTKDNHWDELEVSPEEQRRLNDEHQQQHMAVFADIQAPFVRPSKATIAEWSGNLIEAIQSGFIDPFEAHMRLKSIMQSCDIALKATEEDAMKAAVKHGKNGVYMGNEFRISDGKKVYKYENCPNIIELERQLKAAKEIAKQMAMHNVEHMADHKTGELLSPATIEYGKESITITFK